MNTPSFSQLLRHPVWLLAFGLGSGLSRKAPGTMGSLATVPVILLMQDLSLLSYLLITAFVVVIGIYICGRTASDLDVHDHPGIVWDEVAGMMITFIAVPGISSPLGWVWLLAGFGLFRLFDIWKPWPIGLIDRQLKGGLGIMFDDVLAGMFALVGLHGLMWAATNLGFV